MATRSPREDLRERVRQGAFIVVAHVDKELKAFIDNIVERNKSEVGIQEDVLGQLDRLSGAQPAGLHPDVAFETAAKDKVRNKTILAIRALEKRVRLIPFISRFNPVRTDVV